MVSEGPLSAEEVLLQLLPAELTESSSQCATSCAPVTDRRKCAPRGAEPLSGGAPQRSAAHHNPAHMTESEGTGCLWIYTTANVG